MLWSNPVFELVLHLWQLNGSDVHFGVFFLPFFANSFKRFQSSASHSRDWWPLFVFIPAKTAVMLGPGTRLIHGKGLPLTLPTSSSLWYHCPGDAAPCCGPNYGWLEPGFAVASCPCTQAMGDNFSPGAGCGAHGSREKVTGWRVCPQAKPTRSPTCG